MDDFALKKGQVYGLIITDLNTHQALDVLPDRNPETLTSWLKMHPSIQIVSRDGSTSFKEAITKANDSIIQVSDRFHFVKNLKKYLSDYLFESHPSILMPKVEKTEVLHRLGTYQYSNGRKRRKKEVDQFESFILDHILEGISTARMYTVLIEEKGYKGTHGAVRNRVEDIRRLLKKMGNQEETNHIPRSKLKKLLWKKGLKLTSDEKEQLNDCFLNKPGLLNVYTSVQEFREALDDHSLIGFQEWLTKTLNKRRNQFYSFAKGLRDDMDAVRHAFTLPYSNGPIEGKICKLKLIKRIMFGRGSISLLRKKVLLSDTLLS